ASCRSLVLIAPSPLMSALSSVPDRPSAWYTTYASVPAVVYGPLTVVSPVAEPSRRKKVTHVAWPLCLGSMPSAYQPSPNAVVDPPAPETPVRVSRLVLPPAPRSIDRSLPLIAILTPAAARFTVPCMGVFAVGFGPYHKSSRYGVTGVEFATAFARPV